METEAALMAQLGGLRDRIERARADQDTAGLFALTAERDDVKRRLAALQAPSPDAIRAELDRLRAQLGSFDPEVGMLTGMSMPAGGAGPGATSASSVVAAAKAAEQQRADAGVDRVEQRIAHLEAQLRALEPEVE